MQKKSRNRELPFVSFIIPTFNAQKHLESCLKSIRNQNYPRSRYEIFVVDGGSKDRTRQIAKKYRAIIIDNPAVDQESGKSLGIQEARGKIIALMDSDNEIAKKDWLIKMVKPLVVDPSLFGVESFYFNKKNDNIFNRYSMAAHIADPFSRCIAARLKQTKKKGYIEYEIPKGQAYPLGANGFLWNKSVIKKAGYYKPMFEESNFSFFAMEAGYRRFARVPGYGIYHYHINSMRDFIKKRLKIGGKFLNRKDEKKRTWLEGVSVSRFILSFFYCATFLGPMIEGFVNFIKTKEKAWLLHPIMSFVSVVSYGVVFLKRRFPIQ